MLQSTLAILLLFGLLPGTVRAAPVHTEFEISEAEVLSFSPDRNWLLASHPITTSAGSTGSIRASLQNEDEPKLCIYAFPSLVTRSCSAPGAYLGESGPGRLSGSLSWAADGESIAFADGSIRLNLDGDIWMMETATGRFTNLTDDGFTGQVPPGASHETPVTIDSDPAFSPDGRSVAFSRVVIGTDGKATPTVARIDLSTGEVATLATLSSRPFQLLSGTVIWSDRGDAILFTTTGAGQSVLGLWSVSIEDAAIRQITPPFADRDEEIILLEVDVNGTRALVGLVKPMTRVSPPYFALIDLETGVITPIAPSGEAEISAYDLTFLPDDSLILAEEIEGGADGVDTVRLLSLDPASGELTSLAENLPGIDFWPTGPGLTAISDDLIAYPVDADDRAPWVIVSLSGLSPMPATPAAGVFRPGMTLFTTGEVGLRTTPSATGVISVALAEGAELIVIDIPVEIDGFVWIPVRDVETGALGYLPSLQISISKD